MKRILLLLVVLLTIGIDAVLAQGRRVTGRVLDETGQGLPGAGITVKGTQVGTVSDLDGNFQLNVPDGSNTLVVQAVGYATQEVPANPVVTVRMQTAAKELQGAVVTALAIKREKREIGYSATTLSNEDLNAGNNTSFLSAIQGKTAGANITSNTGGPGGSTRIVLRGEKSITNNNQALIVVDGIPINNSNRLVGVSSLEQIDFGNRGNDINPEDIENITVLKGPAAAALYGSLAANGAIMITTKSGRSRKGPGKTEVTYSTSYTLSNILKYPAFQNQFGQGDRAHNPNDRRENFSWGLPFDGQLRPWGQVIDGRQQIKPYSAQEDNVKSFFDIGTAWENNLSLGGGDDKGSYFVSLNTLRSNGVVPGNFYNKYGLRFNGSRQLSNKFYTQLNVNYLNIYARTDAQGQAAGGIWDNLIQTPRDIPVWELADLSNPFNAYETKDTLGNSRYGYYGAYADNPHFLAAYYDNRNRVDRMIGNLNVGFKPNDNWDVLNRIGADVVSDRTYLKTPKYSSTPWDPFYTGNNKTSQGGYYEGTTNAQTFYNDLIITHNRQLGNDVELNVLVGNNIKYDRINALSGEISPRTNGLVIPNLYKLYNGSGPVTALNTLNESFLVGIYGDLRLDYKKTLFLELTARNDWSSTLYLTNAQLSKTAFFYPSASVSYVFTETLKDRLNKDYLSFGKLRASYASVGNGASAYANNGPGYVRTSVAGNFATQALFPFNGIAGYSYQDNISDDLRPERTNAWEVGAELGFFRDRLTVDFSYYHNVSIDQILALPISSGTGFETNTTNVGDITNKGIELAVRATPISTRTGFKWEVFGTYTRNKNEVVRLAGGVDRVNVGGFSGMSITATVGKPFGAFYAIDYLRDPQGRPVVDSATGLPRLGTDETFQGTYQPRFIASWGTSLKYKGWALNVLFDTKQGGVFYSNTKRTLDFVGTAKETAYNDRNPYVLENSVYESANGGYVVNTDRKLDPYLLHTSIYQNVSSVHILDASYVKLREISLSYSVPEKMLKRTPFGNLQLGLYGNNLFIWTSSENEFVDPEVNSGGATNEQGLDFTARPSIRNYGARLSISF